MSYSDILSSFLSDVGDDWTENFQFTDIESDVSSFFTSSGNVSRKDSFSGKPNAVISPSNSVNDINEGNLVELNYGIAPNLEEISEFSGKMKYELDGGDCCFLLNFLRPK